MGDNRNFVLKIQGEIVSDLLEDHEVWDIAVELGNYCQAKYDSTMCIVAEPWEADRISIYDSYIFNKIGLFWYCVYENNYHVMKTEKEFLDYEKGIAESRTPKE